MGLGAEPPHKTRVHFCPRNGVHYKGLYLYCSAEPILHKRQLLARRMLQAEPHLAGGLVSADEVPDELKAAIMLFFSILDEKQRRLFAGLESLKLGYGGDQRIAEFVGMDPHTVAKGRRERIEQDFQTGRIRKAGGGRNRVEAKRPKSSPASKHGCGTIRPAIPCRV